MFIDLFSPLLMPFGELLCCIFVELIDFWLKQFELLNNLQKDHRSVQIENVPQLRLAPPAVYHEKVKKGTNAITKESISSPSKLEKSTRSKQLRDVKMKVSSVRLPLRSNLFGTFLV